MVSTEAWSPSVSGNPRGRPPGALNKLTQAVFAVKRQAGPKPEKYDPMRPHAHTMTRLDGQWLRTIEQDGRLFDRNTGIEIILPSDTP